MIGVLLYCMDVLSPEVMESFGERMIERALEHPDTGVREAAVNLISLWESETLLDTLSEHKESTPWLAKYIDQILHPQT